jgi:hypothetical protein
MVLAVAVLRQAIPISRSAPTAKMTLPARSTAVDAMTDVVVSCPTALEMFRQLSVQPATL